MPVFQDQTGSVVSFRKKPLRIISIVPSQSEFLWDLSLGEDLVGITKFCIHPEEMYRSITRVGGTKQLDLEKIRQLKPDLIIGNKEENEKSQIEELKKEFKVWMSDIYTFEDAFNMMKSIGDILDKRNEIALMITEIKKSLSVIKNIFEQQRVAYFIWKGPYMVAAKNTFIDHVLNHLGLENALAHLERYPELDEDTLKEIDPEVCFLSSEPFPFKDKHVKQLKKILPNAKIIIVDGEVFSWYGTRLLHLEKYVKNLPLRHAEH